MAPPPSASLPLTERLMQLAQTLQFGWFVGHLTLLFCTIRYGLSYLTFNFYSTWAVISYRTAFVAAAATYGIVVYKAFRARARAGKAQGSPLAMLADENVQYLVMALVWLFSYQIPLALLPFAVYSVFHVATYTRANLLPTLQPATAASAATSAAPGASPNSRAAPRTSSPLAETIGHFVRQYYDLSMGLVAWLELLLWARVLLSALSLARGTWVLLVVYSVFLRSRYSQSSFVQGALAETGLRIDALLANQSTPPVAREAWGTVKRVLVQATEATDLRRYVGAGQPVKKAQ